MGLVFPKRRWRVNSRVRVQRPSIVSSPSSQHCAPVKFVTSTWWSRTWSRNFRRESWRESNWWSSGCPSHYQILPGTKMLNSRLSTLVTCTCLNGLLCTITGGNNTYYGIILINILEWGTLGAEFTIFLTILVWIKHARTFGNTFAETWRSGIMGIGHSGVFTGLKMMPAITTALSNPPRALALHFALIFCILPLISYWFL